MGERANKGAKARGSGQGAQRSSKQYNLRSRETARMKRREKRDRKRRCYAMVSAGGWQQCLSDSQSRRRVLRSRNGSTTANARRKRMRESKIGTQIDRTAGTGGRTEVAGRWGRVPKPLRTGAEK